ncbi:zinc ribbon domain-containing protein [Amycolatopsis sp. NPDC006131]|uniref:zinc ribbon domain-containing protein n=1 Tax=Amycolatopsis sp. NPDC006131 TaxID=3156731 RepID=UPI0033A519AF
MITVQRCQDCGRRYFPGRLLCAACDGANFTVAEVAKARIETSTLVHDAAATRLVTLVDGDLVLVGALHGRAERGDLVPLHPRAIDGPGPVAVVPGTESDETAPPSRHLQEETSR